MNKYLKSVLLSLMIVPAAANAALIDMSYLMTGESGNKHYAETKFGCYGSKDAPCQYKGTLWKIVTPSGITDFSAKVYFDCSDVTWGVDTPTTWDIETGTAGHAMYKRACGKDQ